MSTKTKKTSHSTDVLIVGAGMSGLFAAWRLLKKKPKSKVIILEKMGQVGGRLETTFVDIKGHDGKTYQVHDEEGGMRFVPEEKGWNIYGDSSMQSMKKTRVILMDN